MPYEAGSFVALVLRSEALLRRVVLAKKDSEVGSGVEWVCGALEAIAAINQQNLQRKDSRFRMKLVILSAVKIDRE